jgi:hypothetical protein
MVGRGLALLETVRIGLRCAGKRRSEPPLRSPAISGGWARSRTVNVVPRPLRLCTVMRPPCAITSSRTTQRPRPMPPPRDAGACS